MKLLKILPLALLISLSNANAKTIKIEIDNLTNENFFLFNTEGYWPEIPETINPNSSYEFTSPDVDKLVNNPVLPVYGCHYAFEDPNNGFNLAFGISLGVYDGETEYYTASDNNKKFESVCEPTYENQELVSLLCKLSRAAV